VLRRGGVRRGDALRGEEKMLIAKRSAAVNEVLDYFIEESEIRHDVPLTRDRVSRWRGK